MSQKSLSSGRYFNIVGDNHDLLLLLLLLLFLFLLFNGLLDKKSIAALEQIYRFFDNINVTLYVTLEIKLFGFIFTWPLKSKLLISKQAGYQRL